MLGYKQNIDRKDVEIGSVVKRFTSGQYVIEEIYQRDDSAWDLAKQREFIYDNIRSPSFKSTSFSKW